MISKNISTLPDDEVVISVDPFDVIFLSGLEEIENKFIKLRIIEDCAHSIEAEYKGQGTGTFGDMGCFSLYVTKNITRGEGGMVKGANSQYSFISEIN